MTVTIGRRELLAALGGAAAAWPLAGGAAGGDAGGRHPRGCFMIRWPYFVAAGGTASALAARAATESITTGRQ
jgi:hypothetical protein